MADLEKTVKIIFGGEDKLSPTIQDIMGDLDSFESSLLSVAEPLANVADGILAVDAALSALAAGGFAYAFIKSSEFEEASVNLEKILGDQKGRIGEVEEAAKTLANTYGKSAVSVIEAATTFKRAGFTISESLDLAEKSIGLVLGASEAEFEIAESSAAIIRTLKGFKVGAEEAGRATDILNTVANEYSTNVTELATGMADISPIAQKMGFTFEETAGLLVPIIEIFGSGAEAAVALRTGLVKLQDDAKPVKDALRSIGVVQKNEVTKELRDGRDIYFDVAKAFQSLSTNAQVYYTTQLTGIRQAAKLSEVFGNLEYTTGITTRALDSAGSVANEVAIKLKTSKVAVDRFIVGFQGLGIEVGDQFRVAATEAINGATDIENAFGEMVKTGAFDAILDQVEIFAKEIGVDLAQIAQNLPEAFKDVNFEPMINAIGNVRDSVREIFSDYDLSSAEGIKNLIDDLVKGVSLLGNVTAGMIDAFKPVFQLFLDFSRQASDMDKATQESFGNILGAAKILTEFGLKFSAFIVLIGDDTSSLGSLLKITTDTITGTFQAVVVVWQGLKTVFVETVDQLLAASRPLAKLFDVVLRTDLTTGLDQQRAVFKEWEKDLKQSIGETADSAIKHLTGMETNFASLADSLDPATEKVKELNKAVNDLPEEDTVHIFTEVEIAEIEEAFAKIPATKTITAIADIDPAVESISELNGILTKTIKDGSVILVQTKFDKPEIEKAVKDVEKELEPLKILEIETKLDIAELEAAADIFKSTLSLVETQIEWGAKLNIAGLEADAEKVSAAFESIGETVSATASASASMFGSLIAGFGDLQSFDQFEFMRILKDEMGIQTDLANAQIGLIDEQIASMKRGDAMFTINGENLTEGARVFMFELLKEIQVEVNRSGGAYFMGTAQA